MATQVTMRGAENTAALVGGVAMSVLFTYGGWGKLLAPAATQAMLAGHDLPIVQFGWILAVIVELGGGLAILFGLFTRPIGLVLAIWCVATALIAHTNFADRNQEIHFLKNMAMVGGFLMSLRSAPAPGVSTHGARAAATQWRDRVLTANCLTGNPANCGRYTHLFIRSPRRRAPVTFSR